jgi:hypothetical protein
MISFKLHIKDKEKIRTSKMLVQWVEFETESQLLNLLTRVSLELIDSAARFLFFKN